MGKFGVAVVIVQNNTIPKAEVGIKELLTICRAIDIHTQVREM
jgi:hypothetical protein